MPSQQDVNRMSNYLHRLISFRDVGDLLEQRDGGVGQFAILLARDGFFHSGNKVVCMGCRRETSFEDLGRVGEPFHNRDCHGGNRVEDEDVTYRQQLFQTDDAAATEDLHDMGVQLKSDPDFSHLAERVRSFQGITLLDRGQTDQLARHGLYYTGVGDTLRCFQCNLHFREVSVHGVERVLQIHRHNSPSCTYDSATN